jgi:hypothetical protein
MQTASPSQNTAEAASAGAAGTGRVLSIDALRGFDMFWIIGGKYLFLGLVGALLQP